MKRTKALALAISAAAALTVGAYSMTTTAAPSYMIETTYYSDATLSNQVGFRVRACNGRTYTSGTVTVYKEVSAEPCFFR